MNHTQDYFDWDNITFDLITGFDLVSKKQESATASNKKEDRKEYWRNYWQTVQKERQKIKKELNQTP